MEDMNDQLADLDPDSNYYENLINENHVFSIYETVDELVSKNPVSFNDEKFISIISQNIRSLNNNLDNFLSLFSNETMPDIFIFSETWHDINTPVTIPGYLSFHILLDRWSIQVESVFLLKIVSIHALCKI